MSEMIEQLADAEHASWARWMDYLFSKGKYDRHRNLIIPAESVMHWLRQCNTPYDELTEREKQSDRDEVAKILPFIEAECQAKLASANDEIARLTGDGAALREQLAALQGAMVRPIPEGVANELGYECLICGWEVDACSPDFHEPSCILADEELAAAAAPVAGPRAAVEEK